VAEFQNVVQITQITTGIAAVGALIFNITTNIRNTKSATNQFWLGLRDRFAEEKRYSAHKRIRENKTIEEWADVDDYLGLFEVCEIMLRKKTIRIGAFRALYGYRLSNLLFHDEIVFYKFVMEVKHWGLLYSLIERTFPKAKPILKKFRKLSEELSERYINQMGRAKTLSENYALVSNEDQKRLDKTLEELRIPLQEPLSTGRI